MLSFICFVILIIIQYYCVLQNEILQEISPWFLSFLLVKKEALNCQIPTITACIISAFFQGNSAAQAVAADDSFEQCTMAVPESVCQPDPATMQDHIEKGAVTSGLSLIHI